MKKIISVGLVLGLAPSLALAAQGTTFRTILEEIALILNWVLPILITVAVVYFVWSVIQYTLSSDEKVKEKAKSGIISGLIGIFVIVSFWGIIGVIQNTFKVGNPTGVNSIPEVPTMWVE